MGSYITRTRAWVYIAFYDEYVGRHINTCVGGSLLFIIPMYMYGLYVNKFLEQNANHMFYSMQYFDKRNRLTHNMIMEHFEVHTEMTQDLLVDLNKYGPRILIEVPDTLDMSRHKSKQITEDEIALLMEISGMDNAVVNQLQVNPADSVILKDRLRLMFPRYSGAKEKNVALNELLQELQTGVRK